MSKYIEKVMTKNNVFLWAQPTQIWHLGTIFCYNFANPLKIDQLFIGKSLLIWADFLKKKKVRIFSK